MPRLCCLPPDGSIVSSSPFMPLRKSSGAHPSSNDVRPHISGVSPIAAIPGGDFQIRGEGLSGGNGPSAGNRPDIRFGKTPAQIVVGSDSYVVVRVPPGSSNGELSLGADPETSVTWPCHVGVRIAEGLHPVSN